MVDNSYNISLPDPGLGELLMKLKGATRSEDELMQKLVAKITHFIMHTDKIDSEVKSFLFVPLCDFMHQMIARTSESVKVDADVKVDTPWHDVTAEDVKAFKETRFKSPAEAVRALPDAIESATVQGTMKPLDAVHKEMNASFGQAKMRWHWCCLCKGGKGEYRHKHRPEDHYCGKCLRKPEVWSIRDLLDPVDYRELIAKPNTEGSRRLGEAVAERLNTAVLDAIKPRGSASPDSVDFSAKVKSSNITHQVFSPVESLELNDRMMQNALGQWERFDKSKWKPGWPIGRVQSMGEEESVIISLEDTTKLCDECHDEVGVYGSGSVKLCAACMQQVPSCMQKQFHLIRENVSRS